MQTTPPTPAVVNLTPKKMVAAIKDIPPLTIVDYVKEHFKGQVIRVSGTVQHLNDFGGKYATVMLEDSTGVDVSANFTKPLTADVKLISIGDKLGVVGQVFNVAANHVVLDECKLAGVEDQPNTVAAVSTDKVTNDGQWWTTWWGILILGIVVTVVGGFVLWLMTHRL